VVVVPGDIARVRAAMKKLVRKRDSRIHMTHERDSPRQQIVAAVNALGVHAHLYVSSANALPATDAWVRSRQTS
jgi:hypothetical protein